MTTKFKNLLFASLVAIPISLASCNNGEKKKECDHHWSDYTYLDETYHHHVCDKCGEDVKEEHTFSNPVVTTEATCCTEGAQVCTCLLCGYDKVESIPATGVHEYNQTVVLPEDANLKEKATCEHPAIYYKTCACGEFKKEEGAPTFESGEALKHNITSLNVEGKLIKTNYYAFEQFNPDGLTFKAHCSECDKDLVIPAKDIEFKYEKGGSSFAVGETKVTASYGGKDKDITALTVNKAANEILGMEDQDVNCGDKVVFAPYAKFDKDANIEVVVKDKDSRVIDPTAENAFSVSGSPYTATATLAGTDDYDGDTEDCTINVTHPTIEWVTGNFYDKLVCPKCGEVERTFRTQVDVNFDSTIDKVKIDFKGLSSDPTITYKVYDSLGAEFTEEEFNRADYFTDLTTPILDKPEFKQTFTAVEDDTGIEHTITLSINLATKVISQYSDLDVVAADDSHLDIRGIYVVNNDIDCSASLTTPYKKSLSTGNLSNCFHGTFDGREYAIDNLKNVGYGLFCGIGNGQAEGTVKNIRFTNVHLAIINCNHYSRTTQNDQFAPLLARSVANGNISNIHVEVADLVSEWQFDSSGTMMNSILFSDGTGGWLTFKNNYIDTLKIQKKLQFAISAKWQNSSATGLCENNIIKINDYDKIASNQTSIPDGFTIIKG